MSVTREALNILWQAAKPNLDRKALFAIADLQEQASYKAADLCLVCNDIATLIQSDAGDGRACGAFTSPKSVANLMLALAQSFDTIAALVDIGQAASGKLVSSLPETPSTQAGGMG